MYGFIDIEKLKAEGWELTRVADNGCEYHREHMSLDDVPQVDAFRALVDYAASLNVRVSIHAYPEDTPVTNAEAIRSMTDEQLAHRLLQVDGFDTYCKNFAGCIELTESGECIDDSKCESCMLRWLKEEVKQ